MQWVIGALWAAASAGVRSSTAAPELSEMDLLGLSEEQLLSRYQRASRLTC